jgi:TRAP-type transport system periplasmic protein
MTIIKIIGSFGTAAVAAAVLGTGSPCPAQEASKEASKEITLVMASAINAENSTSRAMEILKAEVERRSNGMLRVELVTGMKFGGVADDVQRVRTGAIFATWLPPAYISRTVPEIEAVTLPFVFNRYDDVLRVVNGPAGRFIEGKLNDKGFMTLAWMDYGARHVLNKRRPLKTVDDFKNLRIRAQPMEIFHETLRVLGANPFATDAKDIYTVLQQSDVDGGEFTYSIWSTYGFYEKQKYISDTNHVVDSVILIAGRNAFNRLSPEHQKVVLDAAKVAAAQERKMTNDAETAALADLQAKGLQFDPLPHETRMAMHKAAAGVIERMKGSLGAELIDMVVAEAGGYGER